jgi:hypothetical protein
MKKFDNLVIRACKSKNPIIRIQSLLNRYYLNKDYDLMVNILSQICDKYNLFEGIEDYTSKFHLNFLTFLPFNHQDETLSVKNILFIEITTLISKIRLSSIDKFPGYIPPKKN